MTPPQKTAPSTIEKQLPPRFAPTGKLRRLRESFASLKKSAASLPARRIIE